MVATACGAGLVPQPEPVVERQVPARPSLVAENAGTSPKLVPVGIGERPAMLAPASSSAATPGFESHPYHQPMPPVAGRITAPAMDFANLSPGACRTRVRKLGLPVKTAGGARGIATAMRLTGPLHGVKFRGPGPKSIHSLMDCRLVLTTNAFAEVLSRHGVIEVFYGNTYRKSARLPGRRHKRSQHAYGLAMDIVWFKLADKTILRVEDDYHGQRGKPSCGPGAWLTQPTPNAIMLRNVVCDVARAGVFHHMLTPNYDSAHASHLHFDIKRGGLWIAIR
jgi:hypothetical protein